MPITRHFLDWRKPALASAAEYLLAKYRREKRLDLRGVIIAVPGARAGRRLLEVLVQRCEQEGLILFRPEIATEGGLPELLYAPKRPFASEVTQQLAWSAALRDAPKEVLQKIIPHPPAAGDFIRWLKLAAMLRRIHTELAADGLEFGHVAQAERHAGKEGLLHRSGEQGRWEAMREVQAAYLKLLDRVNLWDIQTARLVAIEKKEFATGREVVLLGTVDLNRGLRQILDQVAPQATALVYAPEQLADRFDTYGCLIPSAWLSAKIDIPDEKIERVDGPADQAEAVTRWMASLGGKYRADEIVIGVPDEKLVSQLERQLTQCKIETRWVEGRLLSQTPPYRLLDAAARFAQRRRFSDLAALVRHPDVEDWLAPQVKNALAAQKKAERRRGRDIPTALDLFYNEQFAARIDPQRIEECQESWPAIHALVRCVDTWLSPIDSEPRPLSAWVKGLRKVLQTIYGSRVLDMEVSQERYLLKACEQIESALESLALVPPELEPTIALPEAMELVLEPLKEAAIPPPPAPSAVEILGWLELALDDAPALAVTSVNEGFVPKSNGSDAFLPDGLRLRLGLLCNDRRYARDAYALTVLLASRQELRLIVGHRDPQNNPLVPSRLLFAAEEEAASRRALWLFEKMEETPRRSLLASGLQQRALSDFFVPLPKKQEQLITSLSVSQFKAYLACKYRFYLSQILRLEALADSARELDPAAFGSLVHDVLQHFGRAETGVKTSARPKVILDFVFEQLEKLALARYGRDASRSAIRFQIEQARLRLGAFAHWQARQTDEGWQIIYAEDSDKQLECDFLAGEAPMKIRGRIDRIDYHAADRLFRVLDYKTSDNARTPNETHLKSGAWIDLQLPLYRYLVKTVEWEAGKCIDGDVQLGYVNLPKDLAHMGHALALWTPDELESADETARGIIQGIAAGNFWPLTDPAPSFSEDFAAICQDNLIGKRRQLEEETELP